VRLMLDAHIWGSKVGLALEELGHNVKATEKMERIPDEVLLEMAAEEGRVLVTHNVKDFACILQRRPPEKSHSGFILIPRSVRLNDFGAIISGIHETISGLSDEEWVDKVEWMRRAVDEPTGHRLRRRHAGCQGQGREW
jgi:hypothetical protein